MKKLMSLGCLMALIFAGASAFATDWFDAVLPSDKTLGNGWTAIPDSWVLSNNVGTFNDWDNPLTYEAESPVAVSTNDATVITSLMFTAIDGSEVDGQGVPVDLAEVPVGGAKAGLTVVEKTEGYRYYGLYKDDNNSVWKELTGATPVVDARVTVKIALCKYGDGAVVKYSVNDNVLTPVDSTVSPAAPAGASFQTIEFRGNCPEIASLNGKTFANGDNAKESINTGAEPGGEIPTTIQVSRTDLLERGIDPDNATAVKNYLTQKQTGAGKNGQYGWVNVALGIDDTNEVAVASTDNTATPGEISVNFGFVSDGSSTIQYVVDNAKDPTSEATISTAESGIHTVTVKVKQGDAEVTVVTEQVGVMNTGKTLTEEEKIAKGDVKIYDIVAVPFNAFKGTVTVANVLNTAELTVGDTLYILNDGKYDTYELKAGKVWEEVGETSYSRQRTSVEKVDPENYNLTPGQAIWIERNANSKIVFTGKGDTTDYAQALVKAGEFNLIANPTIKSFALANGLGVDGDQIIVEDVANPIQYQKVGGVWGKWVTQPVMEEDGVTPKKVREHVLMETVFDSTDSVIPGGIGFWYKSAGKDNFTINFGTNL